MEGQPDRRQPGSAAASRPGVGAGAGDQAPVKYGECWNWPQLWQQTVAVQRPDVSLVMLGHWEIVNRNVNGKVMHIGQPVYDKLLKAQFEKAVAVLGSAGRQGRTRHGALLPASRASRRHLLAAGRLPPGAGVQQDRLGGRRRASDERGRARPLPVLQPGR